MEPIRSEKTVKRLIEYILKYGFKRDAILVLFGLNTLLRISDMLDITYEQIFDESGNIREYFDIIEKKSLRKAQNPTKRPKVKVRRIKIPAEFGKELKRYAEDLEMVSGDYFFYSTEDPTKAMHRKTSWRRLRNYGKKTGIALLGCHGIRKTGGYLMWKKGIPIRTISELYGHTNVSQTMQYISLNQDICDEAVKKMNFSFTHILNNY